MKEKEQLQVSGMRMTNGSEPTTSEMIGFLNSPIQRENESFEQFKSRRTFSNKFIKAYKKGKVLWDPSVLKQLTGFNMNLPFTDNNVALVAGLIEKLKEKQNEQSKEESGITAE